MSEPERCHCARYTMSPACSLLWQPRDLEHTRDACEGVFTPVAQAVLDAAVQYYDQAQRGDTATAQSVGEIADAHDALYDAIRRYREMTR